MSSISSGSIHCEINDFDVKSICQYAPSICRGQYSCAKYTFLTGKKLPQMALLPPQLCAIYVICVYFYQLYSQISPQSKMSIANMATTSMMSERCACNIPNGCAHKAVPNNFFFSII